MKELESTLAKANVWIHDLALELGCEPHVALRALRAVLHALRDRLPVGEAADLGAQMPMLIRGLYFEGWRPAGKPDKMNRAELLARVAGQLEGRAAPDAEDAIRAVGKVLARHISPGELEEVEQALPRSMWSLWPM